MSDEQIKSESMTCNLDAGGDLQTNIARLRAEQQRLATPTTDRDELVEADIPLMLNQLRWLLKSIAAGSDHRDQLGPWIERVEQAAARIQADAATIARMREALNRTQADLAYIERMPTHGMNDQCYIEAMRRNISEAMGRVRSALKGGDHGIAAMGEGDVR